MGLFDSIYFACHDCGKRLEAQSKSGQCGLFAYEHTAVPLDVAFDANRHAPFRCECGASYEFLTPEPPGFVVLQVKKL